MPTRHVCGPWIVLAILALLAAPACREDGAGAEGAATSGRQGGATSGPDLEPGPGVDPAGRTLSFGALSVERGPAAWLGRPYALGARVLVAAANAGDAGVLREGWSVELIERDHGFDPDEALAAFREIEPEILAVSASFGTPTTLALRRALERADAVALPGSLDGAFAEIPSTPPLAPSYRVEAMRAMDWAVRDAGGAENVRAGAVYQDDEYGRGALEGWQAEAEFHGIDLVGVHAVEPGQEDYASAVAALQRAGAEYVLLATLPGTSGAVLGTAAQIGYGPYWLGNTPAWSDRFFDSEAMPPAVVARFRRVSGLPYWGEDVPGMEAFLAAWTAHGGDPGRKGLYVLVGWTQGLLALEVAGRAMERGDVSREGYLAALHTLDDWDAGGLVQPVDYSEVPYRTSDRTRVLRPVTMDGTWGVVGDWAEPASSR